MREQQRLEIDDDETGAPEHVDGGVAVHDATDEERDERPQPRDTERDRQVLPKGPVHRDGLAERVRARTLVRARFTYAH